LQESYLFKAALSELRTEVQVMRRNDMQMLQTEMSLTTREVDQLGQALSEGLADMKNEIQMDVNNRRNETREDQKSMDMKIQEINNKFTIRLGDIRTEIEAVRWETIWKGMSKFFFFEIIRGSLN
jgi:prophage DNA circulation protein